MFHLPTKSQAAACRTFGIRCETELLQPMADAYLNGPAIETGISSGRQAVRQLHNWIEDGMTAARERRLFMHVVDREVSLEEAVAAITRPALPGEWRIVPVSSIGNDPNRSILNPHQNLHFRFLHDWLHAHVGADASFAGELALTAAHMISGSAMTWPIISSEVAGQAAVAITTGQFPEQRLSRACHTVLWSKLSLQADLLDAMFQPNC